MKEPLAPLYPRLLGAAWQQLSDGVRHLHASTSIRRATGAFTVLWGTSARTSLGDGVVRPGGSRIAWSQLLRRI